MPFEAEIETFGTKINKALPHCLQVRVFPAAEFLSRYFVEQSSQIRSIGMRMTF